MEVAGDVQGELGFGFSQNFDCNQSGLMPPLFINFCQGAKLLSIARIGTGGRTGRDMISCATSHLSRFPPR